MWGVKEVVWTFNSIKVELEASQTQTLKFLYLCEICRICREFEAIRECALKVPETTEEMVETVAYVKKVKDKDIKDLLLRIKVNYSSNS